MRGITIEQLRQDELDSRNEGLVPTTYKFSRRERRQKQRVRKKNVPLNRKK